MTRFTLSAIAFSFAGYGAALAADDTPAPAGGDHMGGFRQACGADLQTYCSASKTRDERHACVDANKDKFSDTCKTYMAQHPHGHGPAPTTP
jgi:hypothetical protein